MRLFWIILALAFAACGYLAFSSGDPTPANPTPTPTPTPATTPSTSGTSPTTRGEPTPVATPNSSALVPAPSAEATRTPTLTTAATPSPAAGPSDIPPPPVPGEDTLRDKLDTLLGTKGPEPSADRPAVTAEDVPAGVDPGTVKVVTPQDVNAAKQANAAGSSPAADASEVKLEPQPDGSTKVDGRFTIKGSGTAESPYEVPWEMLVSGQETYDPRSGKKTIPARLQMLDGKHVRVTGYVAFPLYVEEPKELLSMLNQWDGCCIGVPPTPYDAIEVQLKESVKQDDRLATYGVVEGKFLVKPYLVGDWLVGLYVMESATLTVKRFGGFGS